MLIDVPDTVAVVVASTSLNVNAKRLLTAEDTRLPDTVTIELRSIDTEFTDPVKLLPAIVGLIFAIAEPTADVKELLAIVGFNSISTEFTADVSD